MKKDSLEKIRKEVLNCKKCPLYKERGRHGYYPVIGEGREKTKIIFVGEAPGLNEAKTGRPFCGSAGKILDELFNSVKIKRESVYITNIVKDRPPKNRPPRKEEIEACVHYLARQIEIIKPKVICALGNYSTTYIMEKFGLKKKIQEISKLHGKIFQSKKMKIIPFYHPAAAIYNSRLKKILKNDFKKLLRDPDS
jgi:DNA polymerase